MRDIPTSPRIIEIRHKRRIRRIRLSILFLILIILIIGVLSYLSSNKKVVIDTFEINGTHIINKEDIEEKIKNDIGGKYIYLFSKANTFIYPHKKIYNNLLINIPRIETLSISRVGLKTLKIEITERTGEFLYCGNNIPENKEDVGENCYFVNNDGYIFDRAPYFSGNVYFKYYMSLGEGNADPLAKQMMEVEKFYQMVRFVDGVTSIGFKPIYLVKGTDGTNSLYLDNNTNESLPKIIFKDSDNLEILLDNLSLAMKKKNLPMK